MTAPAPSPDRAGGTPQPLVSVITICRNAEALIEETMRSVCEQSYRPLEYILVDGRSTDGTVRRIREVAARYDLPVTVVSEPDDGIADAMNKGVRLASGTLVTHLHAGDRYTGREVLEKVVASQRGEGWRWGVAASVVVDGEGRGTHTYRADPDHRTLMVKNCIPHQSTFLLKEVFERHGFFDTSYRQGMDYEFWLRIAFRGGERYAVLPFVATAFLEGGTSSRTGELLRYLFRLRREMRRYGCPVTVAHDAAYFLRVLFFIPYYSLKKRVCRHENRN